MKRIISLICMMVFIVGCYSEPKSQCFQHYTFADGTEDYCQYENYRVAEYSYSGCLSGNEYNNAVNVIKHKDCLKVS